MIIFFLFFVSIPGSGINFSGLAAQSNNGLSVKGDTSSAVQTQEGKEAKVKAPGEGYEEDDFRPKVEDESYGWLLVKTIFVLALLIGGFYLFYRFISLKGGVNFSGQEVVQILSVVSLGTGKFLYIVDIAGKVFVLGVTESGINLLTEIDDREDIDRIRLLSSRSTPNEGKNFQDLIFSQLGRFVDKINEKKIKKSDLRNDEYEEQDSFDVNYLKSQKDRLKKINGKNE